MPSRLLACIALLWMSGSARAQLTNTVFLRADTIRAVEKNRLYFSFDNLNFLRNNEYFGRVASGYTLFGYQLLPEITYQPAANVTLRGGALIWKDFGNDQYTQVLPTFRVKVKLDSLAIIFGTLEGNLNHQLIEPLYGFERLITNRLENGVQFLYHRKKFRGDLWTDWQRMIYRDSDFPEELSVGLSAAYRLVERPGFYLEIPVQGQAFHRGGQIGQRVQPTQTWMNGAIGVRNEHQFGKSALIRRFRMDNFVAFYRNLATATTGTSGWGGALYMNFTVQTRWVEVMASYWQGNQFQSLQGGDLYQSESLFPRRIQLPDTTIIANPRAGSQRLTGNEPRLTPVRRDPDRELIILRFMRDFKIFDGFFITGRLEPIFNLTDRKLESAYGMYLTYRQRFLLKTITPD